MTTTASNWFSAMTLRLAQLDEHLPRTVDWKQSLFTIQLRVVGFAYHRDEFAKLECDQLTSSSRESSSDFVIAPPGSDDGEALSLDAALAAAELWAASQSLYAARDTMFRVVGCALGLKATSNHLHPSDIDLTAIGQAAGRSKAAFMELYESKEFQYLDGLLKLSKHRTPVLVRPRQHVAGCPGRPQLMIRDFHFESEASVCSFAPKWATEFLHDDCERVIELCNQLGETLVSEMV